MKLDWNQFKGRILNVTMHENYGIVMDEKSGTPVYEIVFKTGSLLGSYDEGLLLESQREGTNIKVFIPYQSIKCVEIL